MEMKHYLVTNSGEGSILVAGRSRVEIPGKCENRPVAFPASSASTTVARLKQMYPTLQFKTVTASAAKAAEKAETKTVEVKTDTAANAPAADTKADTKAKTDGKK